MINLDENRTIATYLQSVGIKTGFIGKYMHGYLPGYVPPGWDSFVANENGGMLADFNELHNITYGASDAAASIGEIRYSNSPKLQYITNFQTQESIDFITTFKEERFFLLVSYYAPHVPHIPEKTEDYTLATNLSFSCQPDAELALKPGWVNTIANLLSENPQKQSECGEKAFYGQVALLQSIDRGVQRIFDTLKQHALDGRTAVIFTSDNGIILGSKILFTDKGMPYEDSIRVPLLAFIPDVVAQTHENLVAVNLDLGATIFDLAGVHAPTEGQSIMDIIAGRPWKKSRLLIENYGYLDWMRQRYGHPLPPVIWSGFRTPRWKYVEYTTGEVELYDLEVDPDETANIANDPAQVNVVAEFHRDLDKERGLAMTTASIPTAYTNSFYQHQLRAWGGVKPYTWRANTTLPSGLALDKKTGRISGRPQKTGKYELGFTVIDSSKAKHSLMPDHFSWTYSMEICSKPDGCW